MEHCKIEKIAKQTMKETGLVNIPVEIVAMSHYYNISTAVFSFGGKAEIESCLFTVDYAKKHPEIFSKELDLGKKGAIMLLCDDVLPSNAEMRYNMARELAAYLLCGCPPREYCHVTELQKYDEFEKRVTRLAGALLIPKKDLRKYLRQNHFASDNKKINNVSMFFCVPRRLAETRLKILHKI